MGDWDRFARGVEMILLFHAAATWAMVGLIWFVQLVHYPLFSSVGESSFVGYEARHTRATTSVVAMFMPLEAVTGLWLVLGPPEGVETGLAIVGLVLVGLLWLSTVAWQAPIHGKLSRGFDGRLYRLLVGSNWLRTILWSVRGVIVLVMVSHAVTLS
ncbi:MAG: hypothetical protein HKO10_01965 [Acidimicrobiia bacterium]|nr:hypothetical protein [Acidimicrobiia bacterium]